MRRLAVSLLVYTSAVTNLHGADLPAQKPVGRLELVAKFTEDMPTGVTVSKEGRVFVNFPRWEEGVETTVAELVDGKPVPFPSKDLQQYDGLNDSDRLISVQSVVVGPEGLLWILDTGRPQFTKSREGGPKLLAVDLSTNEIAQRIVFSAEVALPTTYLNDVRFADGKAFISDSSSDGPNGIIVVDLESKRAWRKLHDHPSTKAEPKFIPYVEGQPLFRSSIGSQHMKTGVDGIALGTNIHGDCLYYKVLAGRQLFSIRLTALADPNLSEDQTAGAVIDHGDTGFASDGLESDDRGNLYLTNYEDNAVVVHRTKTTMRLPPRPRWETLASHPTMLWPDTLSVASGYLYITCNQLHRQASFQGTDQREKPYLLYRVKLPAEAPTPQPE